MEKMIGAIWRFSTDECPGGKKFTAICMKGALVILVIGVYGVVRVAPEVWGILVEARDEARMARQDFAEWRAVAGFRISARDRQVTGLEQDMDNLERQVNDHERRIYRMEGRP